MKWPALAIAAFLAITASGCIPHPSEYRLRLRPIIENAEGRTLLFRLTDHPRGGGMQYVVADGQLVAPHGQARQEGESGDEFRIGVVTPLHWNGDRVTLEIRERLETHEMRLPVPEQLSGPYAYIFAVRVPVDIEHAALDEVDRP